MGQEVSDAGSTVRPTASSQFVSSGRLTASSPHRRCPSLGHDRAVEQREISRIAGNFERGDGVHSGDSCGRFLGGLGSVCAARGA